MEIINKNQSLSVIAINKHKIYVYFVYTRVGLVGFRVGIFCFRPRFFYRRRFFVVLFLLLFVVCQRAASRRRRARISGRYAGNVNNENRLMKKIN